MSMLIDWVQMIRIIEKPILSQFNCETKSSISKTLMRCGLRPLARTNLEFPQALR
jgi:hypothetical protein